MNIKNLIITYIVALFLSACGDQVIIDEYYEYAGYEAVFYHPGFEQVNGTEVLSTYIEGVAENFTVSFWFNYRRTASFEDGLVYNSKALFSAGTYVICIDHFENQSDQGCWLSTGEKLFDIDDIMDGQMHHFAMVATSVGTKFYLDNVMILENGWTSTFILGGSYIAYFGGGVYKNNISVDYEDIVILPFAATAQDVNTLYQAR